MCYLAAPQLISAHYQADSVTHPMLINVFIQVLIHRLPWVSGSVSKPGWTPSTVWARNFPIHLQCLETMGSCPQVRVFKMIWFTIALIWVFLANLLYFQRKPQLVIVTDIFKLSNGRHKSALRVSIWLKKGFLK